ncbi:MAG: hypothetical protein ABIZ64_14455 [Casimicrobium sp.]|jgi:hypothetical protein
MTSLSTLRSVLAAHLLSSVCGCAVVDTGVGVVKAGASVVGTTIGVAGTAAGVAITTAGVAKAVAVTTAGVAVATTSTAMAAGSLVVSATTSAANARRADDIATASVVAIAPDRFGANDGRVWVTRNCADVAFGEPALWVARRSGENEIRVNERTSCQVVSLQ